MSGDARARHRSPPLNVLLNNVAVAAAKVRAAALLARLMFPSTPLKFKQDVAVAAAQVRAAALELLVSRNAVYEMGPEGWCFLSK